MGLFDKEAIITTQGIEPNVQAVVEKAKASKGTKIKITKPVTGKFLLSYSVGEIHTVAPALATELVDNNYAELVKMAVYK